MARMESEKDKTDQFDDTPLGRYITQQIRSHVSHYILIIINIILEINHDIFR